MPLLQTMFQPVQKIDKIEADTHDRRFRLKATGGGFLANLLGMGSKSSLTADADGFRLKRKRFGQEDSTFVPRDHIASTLYIVMKPLELLILGLLTLVILIGVVFIVLYFVSRKRVVIGVISTGGTVESVKLKANADELSDILEGLAILESLIRERAAADNPDRARRSSSDEPRESRRSRRAPVAEEGGTRQIACPGCGAQLTVNSAMAGKKVRCSACREVMQVPEADE